MPSKTIGEMESKASTPMRCPECDSTHFIKVHVEQFNERGHGTAEFRSLTPTYEQPRPAYICLCGHVMEPAATKLPASPAAGREAEQNNRLRSPSEKKFIDSLRAAIQYQLKKLTPEVTMGGLVGVFASLEELGKLREEVQQLKRCIRQLSVGTCVKVDLEPGVDEAAPQLRISNPSNPRGGRRKKPRA